MGVVEQRGTQGSGIAGIEERSGSTFGARQCTERSSSRTGHRWIGGPGTRHAQRVRRLDSDILVQRLESVNSGRNGFKEVIVIQGRSTTLILVFAAGLFLGMVSASRLAAQFRVGNNRQLSKTDLVGCAGKEVIVALNEFGPGTSGAHYHQGDSFTYVLEGSETYHVEGQPEIVVKTG